MRAAVRRESHQKRTREKHSQRGLTASYLEPDNFIDDEVGAKWVELVQMVGSQLCCVRMEREKVWRPSSLL